MPGRAARRCSTGPTSKGLRLDEAMHPLTLLAVGLYGEVLPNQNGAPVRLVVPWKYGFKSAKSIVRIRFVEKQPPTSWRSAAPQRIRLLFQRQPGRRPPALEPGHRAPHRRGRPVREEAPDADVQRLRGAGRAAVRRHGPEEVLLNVQLMPAHAGRAAPRAGEAGATNRLLLRPAAKAAAVRASACCRSPGWSTALRRTRSAPTRPRR